MISKYTWPNFRGGSEKDGCRVLIDEQGFSDDVKYGTTKIFIQSPQTISQLEYARLELIPGIVVFLQKVSLLFKTQIFNVYDNFFLYIFNEDIFWMDEIFKDLKIFNSDTIMF